MKTAYVIMHVLKDGERVDASCRGVYASETGAHEALDYGYEYLVRGMGFRDVYHGFFEWEVAKGDVSVVERVVVRKVGD